jgi:hypothetical protein
MPEEMFLGLGVPGPSRLSVFCERFTEAVIVLSTRRVANMISFGTLKIDFVKARANSGKATFADRFN